MLLERNAIDSIEFYSQCNRDRFPSRVVIWGIYNKDGI